MFSPPQCCVSKVTDVNMYQDVIYFNKVFLQWCLWSKSGICCYSYLYLPVFRISSLPHFVFYITASGWDIKVWFFIENVVLNFKNLSPVTGADGIFRYRGELFMQYRGSAKVLQKQSSEIRKFPSVLVTSDSFFFLHIIFRNKNRNILV